MKVIYIFVMIIISLFGGTKMSEYANISDYFKDSYEIIVYNEGYKSTYSSTTPEYNEIIKALNTICIDAREMPAFGVALDNETKEALQTGIWVELIFKDTYSHNDMPFNALLISVGRDYTGFNIIRKQNDKYDGRCFYLSLEKDMSILYDYIISIQN